MEILVREKEDQFSLSTEAVPSTAQKPFKLWMPKRVLFTPEAWELPYAQEIYKRVEALNIKTVLLPNNRLTGLRGEDERETYRLAKSTMAVVIAPPSAFKLRPIPPSADYQFHLAEGCPAHCQYCYLAGSLQGPPAIRVFANLGQILENLRNYESSSPVTTFEASCYTDPLSLEHLTGGLARTIAHFGHLEQSHLRFVTKFQDVTSLLHLDHAGHTRFRCSLNAYPIAQRLETGTPGIDHRIQALRRMALPKSRGGGGYKVGVVLAPIIPIPEWRHEYRRLLTEIAAKLDFDCDLTFELITHRFTPGSKSVLMEWYPNTSLDMDEASRSVKRNKFGGSKFVFPKETMTELRHFFEGEIAAFFPRAKILYWT